MITPTQMADLRARFAAATAREFLAELGRRLARVERVAASQTVWHQGTVTDASNPARITVQIARGPVPDVATEMDGYRAAPPAVGHEVWVVELPGGRWLCVGRFD